MPKIDPRFLYLILVLPSLFGLTLIGEGLNKIIHSEWHGIVSLAMGIGFLGLVILAYFYFTQYIFPKV